MIYGLDVLCDAPDIDDEGKYDNCKGPVVQHFVMEHNGVPQAFMHRCGLHLIEQDQVDGSHDLEGIDSSPETYNKRLNSSWRSITFEEFACLSVMSS